MNDDKHLSRSERVRRSIAAQLPMREPEAEQVTETVEDDSPRPPHPTRGQGSSGGEPPPPDPPPVGTVERIAHELGQHGA